MVHPRVRQLRFARSEWLRGLGDISPDDAIRRFEPMNCLSWIIGHLAWGENRCWLQLAQGMTLVPELDHLVGYGSPPSIPPLDQMQAAWRRVTEATNPFLDGLTTRRLQERVVVDGRPQVYVAADGRKAFRTFGSLLQRVTYHYWYHIGEAQAIRQLLGHSGLPDYVGDIELEAPFTAECVE
jgi:uncharacterized damage-inducible protein DinB